MSRPGTAWAAAIAGVMSLLVSASWAPFVEQPSRMVRVAALAIAALAVVGTLLRSTRSPRWLVPVVQLTVALVVVQWRTSAAGPLWRSFGNGARAINSHEAPVALQHAGTVAFLAVCAVVLAVTVDLAVVGLRRTALAGLPLLLGLTVPISTLDASLPRLLLVAVLGCAVILLSLEHQHRLTDWGPVFGAIDRPVVMTTTTTIGAAAVLAGMLLAGLAPLGSGWAFGNTQRGDGARAGLVVVDNPMVQMRRGLINQSDRDMLTAWTDVANPRYLRLAVLDDYGDGAWLPSRRELPRSHRITRGIPEAPGLGASVLGQTQHWTLQYSEVFDSRWLATPYPYESVRIDGGDYRYDERTLDLFDTAQEESTAPHSPYEVTGFQPAFTAEDLAGTASAPPDLKREMTRVPKGMPAEIRQLTKTIVADARTDYQRAVALQRWFRETGGFRYSLWDGSGTGGTEGLMSFLTREKVGYCEQFATAMGVMARLAGVPARVVVGFGRPHRQGEDGSQVFTGKSLHSWTEIYFEGLGWIPFDPTPAVQSGEAPAYTLGVGTSAGNSAAPATKPSARPKPAGPRRDQVIESDNTRQSTRIWPFVVLGTVLVLMLMPRLIRSRQRHRRLGLLDDTRVPADRRVAAGWQEVRATALDHGVEWPESMSPRHTLGRVRRQLDLTSAQAEQIDDFTRLVERARYAREFDLGSDDLDAQVRMLVRKLGEKSSRADLHPARLLPVSLIKR